MHTRVDSGIAIGDYQAKLTDLTSSLHTPEPNEAATLGNVREDVQPVQSSSAVETKSDNANDTPSQPKTSPLSYSKGPDWPEHIPGILSLFIDATDQYPQNLALASIHQDGELHGIPNLPLDHDAYHVKPYVRWSLAEFASAVTRTIRALQQVGAREGLPIFTFLGNVAEYPLILWAGVALGCTIVPIHPRTLLNKEEALHVLTKASLASNAKDAIVFVQTADLAKQILDYGVFQNLTVVTMDGDKTDANCYSFEQFFLSGKPFEISELSTYLESSKSWTLILFTSGTTALPKGVVIDATKVDLWMERRRNASKLIPGDSTLLNLPNNHAFYYINVLLFQPAGGAVVLSGTGFAPHQFPEIMELEKCTDLPMPPALIHAVTQVAVAKNIKFTTLKRVPTGGGKLSIEFLRNCLDVLGGQSFEIMYGSTEIGIAVSTGLVTNVDQIARQGDASVGKADLGAEIKICAPGTRDPLPLNTEGEIHYGSLLCANGYAGEPMPQDFYKDEKGQMWFATGDAGTMNEEGLVFVIGRIKDLIIRGGENISPAAIEYVLSQDPGTKGFNVQAVAKPDPIAGEVPIVVSQHSVTLTDIDIIQNTVLRNMGPMYLPEEVLTLEQLGLSDFPKTTLGKVQKGKLAKIVKAYLETRDAPKTAPYVETDELTSKVQKVWKRTIGHQVDIQAQISDFADSITIMRIRERLVTDLGANITLSEILGTTTVGKQIELIRERAMTVPIEKVVVQEDGALGKHDLVHLAGKPERFASTKSYISHAISKVGLAWEDVQAVTPASDFTQILTQADILNTSWSWKFALLARTGVDKNATRRACEVVLANNPILASFLFSNRRAFGSDTALHVMLRAKEKLFDLVCRDHGTVANVEDFTQLVYKPYEYEMSVLPGLLCHFLLFDIKETGQSGVVMVAHHAVTDASYLQLIFDDLDKALGGATSLPPHISYKTWADSYYSLRTTHEAQIAVQWHVDRLQDLSDIRESVYPQLPRPHHFQTSQQHIQEVDDNGLHFTFPAKGLTNLRRKHSALSAPAIIKAAWSLLNMHRNGTDTAIFSNLQADRRRFPFVPRALEALSPAHTFEASNVAGNTLQDVVNIIPLQSDESILQFLHRITADQTDLNTYAAAPLKTILESIGPINSEIMLDIFRSQIFNWTPGLGAMQTSKLHENFEPVSSFIRPSLRLVINVDVGGLDDETVFAQIKSPLYDMDGLRGLREDFEDFVLWVCDEGDWEKDASEFRSALRGVANEETQTDGGHHG